MVKYGIDNFLFEVIEECKRENLNEREIYWIKQYNSFFFDKNSNGYNLTRGGDQNINSCTQQEVQMMIDMWNNGSTTGDIQKAVGRSKWAILSYLKANTNYTPLESIARVQTKKVHGQKSINQYDLNGNFIKNYPSIRAAAKEMQCDPSLIGKAVNGRFKQYRGYIYIDARENQEQVLERRLSQSKIKLKVAQLNIKTEEVIKIFNNCLEAEKIIAGPNHDGTMIKACCRGEYETMYGYKWRFIQ